jgi:hypothetical protein
VERRLLVTLAAWATWSVGVGAVLWRLGRGDASSVASAGRTSMAWGAADAAVIGWGAWRGSRRRGSTDPAARARRLARITAVNAVLDVGYVAGGVALATSPRRQGTGIATAVQGLVLLYLDTRYALEFAAGSGGTGWTDGSRPLHSARARDRRRSARGGGNGPGGNDSVVVPTVW